MYRIVPDDEVLTQVAELPADAVAAFAEVLEVLALVPWNGEPQHADKPDAEVRRFHFGPDGTGQVVYLIVDHVEEVHLLRVQWLG